MTSGELMLFLVGLTAIGCILWAVQYLGKIWTNHLERLEQRDEKMLLELMACNDRLRSIQESFQNPDK